MTTFYLLANPRRPRLRRCGAEPGGRPFVPAHVFQRGSARHGGYRLTGSTLVASQVFSIANTTAKTSIMFEDNIKNIRAAKALGVPPPVSYSELTIYLVMREVLK